MKSAEKYLRVPGFLRNVRSGASNAQFISRHTGAAELQKTSSWLFCCLIDLRLSKKRQVAFS